MNRACRKYYHDLKLLLPQRGKYSKKFLKTIRNDLAVFSVEANNTDYSSVCGRFGSPQEMAECIITKGRSELQKYYPNAIYEGETTDAANSSAYPKTFPEPLTVELLEKHQELSESCK